MSNAATDTTIHTLGPCGVDSPLNLNTRTGDSVGNFVPDQARVLYDQEVDSEIPSTGLVFEKAGPRQRIFFEPASVCAAIVTCGGLCPGINSVIRSVVLELYFNHGVRKILGLRYGYEGLNKDLASEPMPLTPELVDTIHQRGGTILGSSRGNQEAGVMVDHLQRLGVNMLFTVGGDGTQRGAHEIAEEAERRGLKIAVVGIPKTIDNDILYIARTFGYTTAIDRARDVLSGAHVEAKGYPNGIALVKLMGRDSGYIAVGATLASQEVNFTLIPEVPLHLDGPRGFLAALKQRMLDRKHALIVVAEGAGQNLLGGDRVRDKSGNVLHEDIGPFLKEKITAYFKQEGLRASMKYIDPSYYIRSAPANAEDNILCDQYARNAVHAAMAGKTDLVIGFKGSFMHLPMSLITQGRQKVPLDGMLWRSVLATTGQPAGFQ